MTTSSGQQTTQQQSQSQPWAPTVPALTGIVNNLGGFNYAPTQAQNSATSNLVNSAQGIPNVGPTVAGVANNYLNGGANQTVQNALGSLNSNLAGLANPNNLNPLNTPGLSNALNYEQQQIQNSINGQFAGAGRDLSPANTQALAYGETGALAPILTNQYNQNVSNMMGANNALFGAANTANNAYLQNAGFGVNTGGALSGLYTAPGQAQVGAANTQYGTPLSNVGGLSSLLLPIAGLGGQTSQQGQTNTSYTPSPLQDFASIGNMFGGQYSPISGMSAFGQGALNGLGNIFGPTMSWG